MNSSKKKLPLKKVFVLITKKFCSHSFLGYQKFDKQIQNNQTFLGNFDFPKRDPFFCSTLHVHYLKYCWIKLLQIQVTLKNLKEEYIYKLKWFQNFIEYNEAFIFKWFSYIAFMFISCKNTIWVFRITCAMKTALFFKRNVMSFPFYVYLL